MNKLSARDLPADPEQPPRPSEADRLKALDLAYQAESDRADRAANKRFADRCLYFFVAFLIALALFAGAHTETPVEIDGVPPQSNEASN